MNFHYDWSNSINRIRCETLFEHRNKSYGAYEIRKNYSHTVFNALLISTAAIVIIFSMPAISGYLNKSILEKKKLSESINLEEPPPIDKNALPPPPIQPPPPIRQTIKFTPHIIVDNDVSETTPTQDEVKNVQVSTVTQQGEDIVDLPPDPGITVDDDDKVFTIVEEMPSFPGGDKKLSQLLSRITYPQIARENNISGAVYIGFIVEKDGKIKEVKVLRGIGGGCDEEALRVLKSLPDWIPGKQNGRPVAVRSSVRINFTLQ